MARSKLLDLLAPALIALAVLQPVRADADAIIRTQAMLASTIVELFVEEDRVSLDLEIGLRDLEAFRNLLPDAIYEKLGHPPAPLQERLPLFFERDLSIRADGGAPLSGAILEMGPRPRVKRDEITGEPLAQAEEEPELVVFARLEYALPERPKSLTFGAAPGSAASIGFVAYHQKIPVNDFRYLGPSQTLDLDWEDPWYTSFRNRNLRRTYFAPMSGFIYVEPYEVRKEIVLRPRDLQHWVDLGLAGRDTIPVEMQPELKREVAEFLRRHQPVTIDGEAVPPELARINFLERSLRTSRVVDPPVELDAYSAILGVIFVYPTDGLPERVAMDWDLFNERIQLIPASSVDQAGPLPVFLEPDFRVLEWRNFLKHPELPSLRALRPAPTRLARWLLVARWLLLAATVAVAVRGLIRLRKRHSGRAAAAVATSLLVAVTAGSFWLSRDAALSDASVREVVSGLLHNVYRAFDFRDEERVYDVLEKSVDGELLTQIYLETRRGLELANQGGARAKVKQIALLEVAAEPADDGGFVATTTWNVSGSVGHWGHIHQRTNRYRAELRIAPVAGVWKLKGLEILEEERL
jgi:hypothetical protein